MTIQEYINQSARFENISDEMRERLATNADLVHASLGIADEFLELMNASMKYDATKKESAKIQLIKETGDVLWYIAIICRKYSLTINNDVTLDEDVFPLLYLQNILSAIKKHLIYGKDINLGELESNINAVVKAIIDAINEHFDITIEDIMDRNIEKLSARYGETYTNEAAINKNETNE